MRPFLLSVALAVILPAAATAAPKPVIGPAKAAPTPKPTARAVSALKGAGPTYRVAVYTFRRSSPIRRDFEGRYLGA